jgi:hypothetical protein
LRLGVGRGGRFGYWAAVIAHLWLSVADGESDSVLIAVFIEHGHEFELCAEACGPA